MKFCPVFAIIDVKKLAKANGGMEMYQIGEQVLYGIHGVCRITGQDKQMVDKKMRTFLVLEPEGQPGARFLVPTHNESAMSKLCPVITGAEMEALLDSPQVHSDHWISDENRRKQYYRELIGKSDRQALMGMVCTLYRHKSQQAAAGRKCHLCDENFLRDAEKLLVSEISLVMRLSAEDARAYLRQKLKNS